MALRVCQRVKWLSCGSTNLVIKGHFSYCLSQIMKLWLGNILSIVENILVLMSNVV